MQNILIVYAEYFRIFAYLFVIIFGIIEIKLGKYSKALVMGDVFFSIFAISSIIFSQTFNSPNEARLYFITPATILWAAAHLINVSNNNKKL